MFFDYGFVTGHSRVYFRAGGGFQFNQSARKRDAAAFAGCAGK
jgi:hypothetical protein